MHTFTIQPYSGSTADVNVYLEKQYLRKYIYLSIHILKQVLTFHSLQNLMRNKKKHQRMFQTLEKKGNCWHQGAKIKQSECGVVWKGENSLSSVFLDQVGEMVVVVENMEEYGLHCYGYGLDRNALSVHRLGNYARYKNLLHDQKHALSGFI